MRTVRIIGAVLWGAVAVMAIGALVATAPEPPPSSPLARIWTPGPGPAPVASTRDGSGGAGPVIHWGGR